MFDPARAAIPIYQVDAFTNQPFRGNPAAVCPLEEWLADSTLQQIAVENNLSETAFLVREQDEFRLRWFTPVAEVDLCGHATLAAAFVLYHLGAVPAESQIRFATRSGVLTVQPGDDGRLTLDFPAQVAEPCETPALVRNALGADPVETRVGDRDYLAVFEHEQDIAKLRPNFDTLESLTPPGLIVTAPGNDVDFVSRFFVPALGVPEDPVTGSAHCMLTPYWSARLGKSLLAARQISSRSGDLICEDKGDRVLISGHAVLVMEGTLRV